MVPFRSASSRRARRSLLATLSLAVFAACGGGSDAPAVPPTPPPTVRGVSVTPAAATVRVGETQTLSALVDAINGAPTTVSWSSEQPSVASVSQAGVVTGLTAGTATVRAIATGNAAVSGTATITVQPARSVSVTPSSASIGTGQTTTLSARVQMDPGLPTTVQWRSSAPNIATVSPAGVVTGVALGAAEIIAIATADTTVRASAIVTVTPTVRAITVTPTTATLNIGNTRQLAATVTADAGLATTVTWRTSSAAVATVSSTGLVTAVSVGTSTITAVSTADTLRRASATITVAPRITTVAIQERTVSIAPGTSTTLSALVSADPGVNTTLQWTSSTPGVATVNAQGVVSAVANGTTLITAALVADPTRRDTVTVSVVPRLANTWTAARLNGPLHEDVISLAVPESQVAFAVNSTGDVYRWNGTAWSVSATGAAFNTTFAAVHASAANNVIAVGSNGVIVRFNGTTWSTQASGTTRALYAVHVESATSAWAVGDAGTVLRFNNGAWTSENAGTSRALYGVWAGDNVVVAVGDAGTVVRRIVGSWSTAAVPTGESLYGVHGLSASDLVVAGDVGVLLRFNGSTWSLVSPDGVRGAFYAVTGSSANNGRRFIAGDAGVLQLDGSTLTTVNAPWSPIMYAATIDPTGVVWTSGQRGAVLRSGTPWTTNNFAPDLLDVWSTSSTNAFAVGEFGFAYRWNGSAWSRLTTPTTAHLNTVWGTSSTDAFAGGENGTMLRWNGSAWSVMTIPTTSSILALWGSSSVNVFASTRAGELLRFNGTTWSLQHTHTSGVWAVYGVSAVDVVAVGENGSVLRLNGGGWTALPSAGSGTLSGVWMTGLANIYAVGANAAATAGTAWNYNTSSWSPVQTASTRIFTSVWGPGVNDLYVTGAGGLLLRSDGRSWSTLPTGTTDVLWAISAAPDATGAAFAVGHNSTIVTGGSGAALAALRRTGQGTLEPAPGAPRRHQPAARGSARLRKR